MLFVSSSIADIGGTYTTRNAGNSTFLVVPSVMLRHGVIETVVDHDTGMVGSVLVPAEELKRSIVSWSAKPVVVNHPQRNGSYVLASTPDVFFDEHVGYIFNVRVNDNGSLIADLWLDAERMGTLGDSHQRALTVLTNGGKMDVSTGFYADLVEENGSINGKQYSYKFTNIQPDHLALLPDMQGACSWEDGCGVPRVNVSVSASGNLGTVDKNIGIFINSPEVVGGVTMSSCSCGGKDVSEKVDKKKVEDVAVEGKNEQENTAPQDVVVNEGVDGDATPGPVAADVEDVSEPVREVPEVSTSLLDELRGVAELIQEIGGVGKLKEVISGVVVNAQKERDALIKGILSNNSAFSREELEGLSTDFLRKLFNQARPAADYSGGFGYVANNGKSSEPEEYVLPMPSVKK